MSLKGNGKKKKIYRKVEKKCRNYRIGEIKTEKPCIYIENI